MLRSVGLALVLLFVGCARNEAEQRAGPLAATTSTPKTPGTPSMAADSCAIERRESIETPANEVHTEDRSRDPSRLMVWRSQTGNPLRVLGPDDDPKDLPPDRRYESKPVKGKPFPSVDYATVRAFTLLDTEYGPLHEWAENGCEAQVLSEDGKLCPSVSVDGPRLNDEQVAGLKRMVTSPAPGIRYKCGFDPRHAFVFYNAEGHPVSDVRMCFSCGEWSLRNGPIHAVSNEVYAELAALCRELELGRCPKSNSAYEQQLKSGEHFQRVAAQTARRSTPAYPLPSDVFSIPKQTLLSSLSDVQKKQLCAYRLLEHAAPGMGTRLPSGRRFWLRGYGECVERFPSCDVSLGDVERTDFRTWRDELVAAPECLERWVFGERGHCLWGIDRQ